MSSSRQTRTEKISCAGGQMMAVNSFQLYSKSIFYSITSVTPPPKCLSKMHSRLCTGLSLISNPTLQADHGCNPDFVPAPLWPHLMNSPHTLSYLSIHFFHSCWWNYSCRTHASTALQHGLEEQWVELPLSQKTCVEVFCGTKATVPHFQPFSLHWWRCYCTETPSPALKTRLALLPWNTTLTLLLGQYCSNPLNAHLRDHEMSNNGCGRLPWHHTLACCAIEALERSFAGDTREQSPIYFPLGMIVPAQKDTQAALLSRAAGLELCSVSAECRKCQQGKWAQTRQI